MSELVVYYRHAPSEPAASQAALLAQHGAVAAYARSIGAPIIAEFTEEASRITGRLYAEAYRLCAKSGAELVIASVQPIGTFPGLRHRPVPLIGDDDHVIWPGIEPVILGPPLPEPAARLTMPTDAPDGLFLHAVDPDAPHSAIYLCNNTGSEIREARVFRSDLVITPYDGLRSRRDPIGDSWESLGSVSVGECRLLLDWDEIDDQAHHFILFWRDEAGDRCVHTGFLGPSRFMPFDPVEDRTDREGVAHSNPTNLRWSSKPVWLEGFLTTVLWNDDWDLRAIDDLGGDVRLLARIGEIGGHRFDPRPPCLAIAVDNRVVRLVTLARPTQVLEGTMMSKSELARLDAVIDPLRPALLDYWHGRLTTRELWRAADPDRD